ncbi:MAG: sensor histidine kinase [Candidatus Weimeria sp.]
MINVTADITGMAVIFLVGTAVHRIRDRKSSSASYRNYVFVSLIIFCLVSTVILFNNISMADQDDMKTIQSVIPYITAVLGLAIAVLFLMVNSYCEKTEKYKKEMYELKRNSEIQQQYFADQSARKDARKMLMHDMRAHLTAMRQMSEDADYSGLASYIDRLCESYSASTLHFYSGNNYVDAVVSSLVEEAEKAGVHVEWSGTIPSDLAIDQNDICSIVYNILKNAIEAAAHSLQKKEVYVSMYSFNRRMMIMTENSFNSDESDTVCFNTTKSDEENHGYGLKIIQNIIQKYDGIMKIYRDGDSVITEVIVHIRQKQAAYDL